MLRAGRAIRATFSTSHLDNFEIVDIETGDTKTVPFNMTWTPAIPKDRIVVHAGKLLDMKTAALRSNVDVIITGNTITSVVPHAAANHLKAKWSTPRRRRSCRA